MSRESYVSPSVDPAPRNIGAWTAFLARADIPVLQATSEALEIFRADQDRTDANGLGELISNDPLMTLKVLAYASGHRSSRAVTDTETVTAALVMMGITPFFDAFKTQTTVEASLADAPGALQGLRTLLKRVHRGANMALAIAVHRTDPDAAVIHAVALLHEFAEMLMWCHAPAQSLQIARVQRCDAALRSHDVQRAALGFTYRELQASLMLAWRLPSLLVQLLDANHTSSAAVKTVDYAMRLARHSVNGWDNAAIPDDIDDIASLLNMSTASALQFIQNV